MSDTNFVDSVFSNVLELIKLGYLLFFHCVDIKMLVVDNDFLVELINLSLFLICKLFYHIITGYENGFKVVWVRECGSISFDFR